MNKSKSFLVFCFLNLFSKSSCERKITKRSLFFPTTTVLQYTYGLSVPITIKSGTTILLSTCLQGNYDLLKKPSDLQVHELKKRDINQDLSKTEFYENVIEFVESLGYDGEECLLKLICEIAKHPLDTENSYNVIEKIAHFLFKPSFGNDSNSTFHSNLLEAEKAGENAENCDKRYAFCEISLASLFTKFFTDK